MTVVIRGKASDLDRGSDNTIVHGRNGPAHIVNQLASLRIDNKPVIFRSRTLVSIKEGDEVIAAGSMKNGTLDALALRNVSTGASYLHGLIVPVILVGALLMISLSIMPFGIIFLLIAVPFAWRIWTVWQAAKAVKAG